MYIIYSQVSHRFLLFGFVDIDCFRSRYKLLMVICLRYLFYFFVWIWMKLIIKHSQTFWLIYYFGLLYVCHCGWLGTLNIWLLLYDYLISICNDSICVFTGWIQILLRIWCWLKILWYNIINLIYIWAFCHCRYVFDLFIFINVTYKF